MAARRLPYPLRPRAYLGSVGVVLALLFTSLLLTPLVGWVLFAWWWDTRPRAAVQSLALSLPVTLLFTGGVLWWL